MTAERLRWRYRHWRARHYLWSCDLQYRRAATPAALKARDHAVAYLRRVELGKP